MHEQAQEAGLARASGRGLAFRHLGASHADINMAVVVNCKRVGWINCSMCVMTIYRHICDILSTKLNENGEHKMKPHFITRN